MNKQATTAIGIAATLIVGAFGAHSAAADPVIRQIDENRVSITDFRGKPPFRRRIVDIGDLSPAEFARFETLATDAAVDESRIGHRVKVVDFRGKPPFKRRTVEIDASNTAEFARFEELDVREERPRRSGPPGKGVLTRR